MLFLLTQVVLAFQDIVSLCVLSIVSSLRCKVCFPKAKECGLVYKYRQCGTQAGAAFTVL